MRRPGNDELGNGMDYELVMCCRRPCFVLARALKFWSQPYMEALVDALGIKETSDVLEIGFGLGNLLLDSSCS